MKKIKWEGERIKENHVRKAAKTWESDPSCVRFRKSSRYDVYIDGSPYPPKAICGIAYKIATKKILEPEDFGGAKDGYWHKILKNLGFIVAPKYSTAALIEQAVHLRSVSDGDLLAKADETSSDAPKRLKVTVNAFARSPYVVAATLRRANGVCERCKKPAPFNRSRNQTPYLEVHHVKPLSWGGPDCVGNTKALCPNCHCEEHDIMGFEREIG